MEIENIKYRNIIKQAKAGRLEDVMLSLLEFWAGMPGKELGDLIEFLGAILSRDRGPLSGRKAVQEPWEDITLSKSPADLERLMDFLTEDLIRDAEERMKAMQDWPADPRMDRRLVRLLGEVPFQSTSSRKFWVRVFKRAEKITDPSVLLQLEQLDQLYVKSVAGSMGEWLCKKTEVLLSKLSPELEQRAKVEIEPELAELLKELRVLFPDNIPEPEKNLGLLLEHVLLEPGSDDVRLVYADLLVEQGDPRGEFIMLQYEKLKGKLPRAQAQREKELFEKNWKEFLGPLASVVLKKELLFERGFISHCVSKNNPVHIRASVGNPLWATVEHFKGSAEIYRHPVMRSLRSLVFDSAQDDLIEFCRRPEPWMLHSFNCYCTNEEEAQVLGEAVSLPELKSLRVNKYWRREGLYQTVLNGNLARSLEHVCLVEYSSQAGFWQRWLEDNKLKIKTFELEDERHYYSHTNLSFTRDEDGSYSHLNVHFDDSMEKVVQDALLSLEPGSLRTLAIKLRGRKASGQKFEEITRTAERFTHLQSLELP